MLRRKKENGQTFVDFSTGAVSVHTYVVTIVTCWLMPYLGHYTRTHTHTHRGRHYSSCTDRLPLKATKALRKAWTAFCAANGALNCGQTVKVCLQCVCVCVCVFLCVFSEGGSDWRIEWSHRWSCHWKNGGWVSFPLFLSAFSSPPPLSLPVALIFRQSPKKQSLGLRTNWSPPFEVTDPVWSCIRL